MAKRNYDGEKTPGGNKRREFGPAPELHSIFKGEVASVKEYGIFVKIPDTSRQGLVHKSQISQTKVDDPSEMFAKGEVVYCKVISLTEDGDKIGLAMKTVNQTTGQDQDVNNIQLSQDEKKRRQFGNRSDRQKIVLEAVLDTTCKKCGGKGHLAQDCFMSGSSSYDLIPDLDEYMHSVGTEPAHKSAKHKKKEKKKRKEKKSKHSKEKKRRHSSLDSDSSSDGVHAKKKKKRKKSRHASSADSSDSEDKHKKHKSKKRHRKHSTSSSDS